MAAVDQGLFLLQDVIIRFKHFESILAIVGLLYVGKLSSAVAVRLYEGVRVHILSHLWWHDLTRYGPWAGMCYDVELDRLQGSASPSTYFHRLVPITLLFLYSSSCFGRERDDRCCRFFQARHAVRSYLDYLRALGATPI